MRSKVSVIGAGNVGATLAQRIAEKGYADVVVVDIVDGVPQGKGLGMLQTGPITGSDASVIGTNSYEETAKSDIVAITSGVPRKPGMSRDDLELTNMNIVKSVTEQVVKYSPKCILIMVANPLDAMTQLALHVSKFPRTRVFGQSGILDRKSTRLNSSHGYISYAVFCLKKKKKKNSRSLAERRTRSTLADRIRL